jgi:predicted ribosome quality control (RQC) complex YloA/Tae2 family protein
MERYIKYRQFKTSSGSLIIGGKNAEQNEELVRKFIGKSSVIMHTKAAGSPFCIILGKPKRGDLKKAAIFTARYSREWKKNKKDVEVHCFKGRDVYKSRGMKTGMFGVKKYKKIKVKKEDIKTSIKNE